jgi:hypothetical protein
MKLALAFVVVATSTALADVPWSDTPAWPAATDHAVLTWRVYPDLPAKENELTKTPVDLVVAIGAVERVVKLAPQIGQMPAMYQHACAGSMLPLRRGELAQLTFEEGGFGGFIARRADDVLEIVEWNQEDGACDDHGKPVACPRKDKLVARLHVPASVKLGEVIELVDAKGARHPFACS